MRVYVIGRDYQATEIDAGEAAGRFTAWLSERGNPVLAEVIRTWLWQPSDAGGLGALAESERDVEALQAEVASLWRRSLERGTDGRGPR